MPARHGRQRVRHGRVRRVPSPSASRLAARRASPAAPALVARSAAPPPPGQTRRTSHSPRKTARAQAS
eukprot:4818631-Pleurochrysis_carterae.AAC.1